MQLPLKLLLGSRRYAVGGSAASLAVSLWLTAKLVVSRGYASTFAPRGNTWVQA